MAYPRSASWRLSRTVFGMCSTTTRPPCGLMFEILRRLRKAASQAPETYRTVEYFPGKDVGEVFAAKNDGRFPWKITTPASLFSAKTANKHAK